MAELRWNPLLETYIMVANNRQNRPNMPKDFCPFCPGSGKVPDEYDVHIYPNDFPALSTNPPEPSIKGDELYRVKPSYGKCEVVLYSPEHNASLYDLSQEHLVKLINLWGERTEELSKDEKIKYVFPFENRGKDVGVTMPHPHGQIYGYSFIPEKVHVELDNCHTHYQMELGRNLFDAILQREIHFKQRVILENESFLACLPFFTDYPFGVFIIKKTSGCYIHKLDDQEKIDLAEMLKKITGGFDKLYDTQLPYMMCIHQGPVNSPYCDQIDDYYRLHIEFYPPWRAKNVIKNYASSEMGAWAAANTMSVEDTAPILREAIKRFEGMGD